MIKTRHLVLLGAAAILAVGATLSQKTPAVRTTGEMAAAALPAPGWKLRDLEGQEVTSEQFKGKVVVVDFWATWCAPCIEEIPGYIALQKKYGPEGLAIIGISLDQAGPARVKAFAAANGMNYTIVMGDEAVVEAFGGVESIPTTFLISREGRILDKKVGAAAPAVYEQLVKRALQ